jgi:arylformamidase
MNQLRTAGWQVRPLPAAILLIALFCMGCCSAVASSSSQPARLLKDIAYGPDERQRMDIYLPRQPAGAPVIFMVHGGAWRLGDKAAQSVVDNKVGRWVSKGLIFISANYRMLPHTGPVEQAQDVARALAMAQSQAATWGGDPVKFILMGHSAGAHLVALLAASPQRFLALGVRPWLGSVMLDSAALDVVTLMGPPHARLYDQAFGRDPTYWRAASPWHALSSEATTMLVVCSSRRDDSCSQAESFVARAVSLGAKATVLAQDLSHRDINMRLGLEGAYTETVEAFMAGLDKTIARMLAVSSE